VIFDAAAQNEIDLTSTDMLKTLIKELHAKGIASPTVDLAARFVEKRKSQIDHE
jgi:hypothetical protein